MTENHSYQNPSDQPQHDGGRIVATDETEYEREDGEEADSKLDDPRQNAKRRIVASDSTQAAPEDPDAEEEEDETDEDETEDAASKGDSVIRL